MKRHLIIGASLLTLCLSGCGASDSVAQIEETPSTETPVETPTTDPVQALTFASVPTDGLTPAFDIATTEVSNADYALFLTQAYAIGYISYDQDTHIVSDATGNTMTNLNGSRVIKDHNKDGVYALDEMENPLNINFIAFDAASNEFYVEDPAAIDWAAYTDPNLYPNVVDSVSDWYELSGDASSFHGEGDSDGLLPTLAEVSTWPANFITFHGAQAFAGYYNFSLPTLAQWRLAAAGGESFVFSTSDGTANEGIAWINVDGPGVIHKGHVQSVDSKEANPLGIYHMGGNVWEWVADWYDGNEVFSMNKQTEDFFIDDTITFSDAQGKYLKGLIGGSFNYFPQTMQYTWNHAANPETGNDHFGFRVVK